MVEEEKKEIIPLAKQEYVMDYSEDDDDTTRIVRKRWTDEEERIFKQGLIKYGKDRNALNKELETKSWDQIKEKEKVLVKQL